MLNLSANKIRVGTVSDLFYSMMMKFSAIGALIGAILLGSSAHAQVYELGGDGALTVREGGGAVAWRDARAAPAPTLTTPRSNIAAFGSSTAPLSFTDTLNQTAARHRLSPALLEAVVWQESRWHAQAVSPKGAVGLTQLMPSTALALGVDARDPVANLEGGAHYLRLLLDHFGGDVEKSLAAYNAGVARVERAGGIPQIRETQNYVAAIMARLGQQGTHP